MENEQTLNLQSPKPSQSEDVRNSPSFPSFGTVEDFEFSTDESLSKVPSQNTLPEAVVVMPRKRSNALVEPVSPQVKTFHEQDFHHFRNISESSRRTRNSTLTDFNSGSMPTLLFNDHESGEFDFGHQPDNKFSDMMNSNEGNIFEIGHSDWEDCPGLEHSDFEEEEQESNSMYFMGDTITEKFSLSKLKSDDIDRLSLREQDALPLGKEHHGPFESPKMVKSNQQYETDSEELISSPDYAQPLSYTALYKNNCSGEEKLSEGSTPERNRGMNSETWRNWIPVRKHNPFKTKYENYKSRKTISEGMLSKHLKKTITMTRRAQSVSRRKSEVGMNFRKFGSMTLPSNLQFCSPCSPEEDKRTDACIIM